MIKKINKVITSVLLSAALILNTGIFNTFSVKADAQSNVIELKTDELTPTEMRTKSKSAIVMDVNTGEIILSKNPFSKQFPASITKLMTGLLLAENRNTEDILTYTENAKAQIPFSINTNLFILQAGDEMTVEDSIEALMLLSANDVAVMIAENVAKSQEEFVKMMNDKAKSLGMENTHFENPVGLHSEENYSTAYDISLLLKACYENETLRKLMNQPTAKIDTKWQAIGKIENKNELIGIGGNIGGKTGFTEESGRTLTCYYSREINGTKRDLIVTLLGVGESIGDSSIFREMEAMAEEGFKTKKVPILSNDDRVGSIPVEYKVYKFFGPKKKISVPFGTTGPVEIYPTKENIESLKVTATLSKSLDPFKLKYNTEIGTINVVGDKLNSSTTMVSRATTTDLILVNNILWYLGLFILVFIIGTIIIVLLVRNHRKKKYVQERIRKNRHNQRRRNIRTTRIEDEI